MSQYGATADLFNRHLEKLRDKFTDAGLCAGTIRCQEGIPTAGTATEQTYTLVDEKA